MIMQLLMAHLTAFALSNLLMVKLPLIVLVPDGWKPLGWAACLVLYHLAGYAYAMQRVTISELKRPVDFLRLTALMAGWILMAPWWSRKKS